MCPLLLWERLDKRHYTKKEAPKKKERDTIFGWNSVKTVQVIRFSVCLPLFLSISSFNRICIRFVVSMSFLLNEHTLFNETEGTVLKLYGCVLFSVGLGGELGCHTPTLVFCLSRNLNNRRIRRPFFFSTVMSFGLWVRLSKEKSHYTQEFRFFDRKEKQNKTWQDNFVFFRKLLFIVLCRWEFSSVFVETIQRFFDHSPASDLLSQGSGSSNSVDLFSEAVWVPWRSVYCMIVLESLEGKVDQEYLFRCHKNQSFKEEQRCKIKALLWESKDWMIHVLSSLFSFLEVCFQIISTQQTNRIEKRIRRKNTSLRMESQRPVIL